MKISRLLKLLFPPLLGATIGVLAMVGCIRLSEANAAALATAADPGPMTGIDWTFWGGVLVAGAAFASLVLHAIASKTHNATVTKLADEIDVLRRLVTPIIPATGVPTSVMEKAAPALTIAPPPRDSQSGKALVATMVWLSMAGLVVIAVVACATAKTAGATAKTAASAGTVAFLECEDGHLDPAALADAKALASAELRHLFGGPSPDTAALKLDLAGVKSDLGRCAWAAAVAAFGAVVKPEPGTAVSALVAAGPDPAQVRAAFAVAARPLGWAPMKMADGTVW